ncbi:hypothetical protein D3C85_1508370 [compost metagenome]
MLIPQPDFAGVRQQRTHLQAVVDRMHAKQGKRIGRVAGEKLINHVTIGKYRHSLLPKIKSMIYKRPRSPSPFRLQRRWLYLEIHRA